MTRPLRRRSPNDVYCAGAGEFSEHLRSHVHLTNCIHLKNQMHRRSPISGEEDRVEAEAVFRHGSKLNKPRAYKFRGGRRTRASSGIHPQNEIFDAQNNAEVQNISGGPGNGCGIPWNWSRVHGGRRLQNKSASGMSENSSTKSEGEVLPLLGFQDHSGELGIFAEKQETDSSLTSEAKSCQNRRFAKQHQTFTQKYTPRTFSVLVGHPLVTKALSNAIARRKIGLLYLFHGPRGTGKTSCARIFARSLNCQSLEHPHPCGVCHQCISQNVVEIANAEAENVTELLDRLVSSQHQSNYRVVILDECDTLSSECWNAVAKAINLAPRRVVFVLVSPSVEAVPHVIAFRCQKFFFSKIKEAEMVSRLQRVAEREGLQIEKDALKLVVVRSNGSLREAEMTLEQLSLFGKRVSLGLVQELVSAIARSLGFPRKLDLLQLVFQVGLVSDEKLVRLLDLALSADTVNTVRSVREIMESGVEPLALMSQLATVITDILAGSFDFTRGSPPWKFFRCQPLSKDATEKLRQGLKKLSEAEKQMRGSMEGAMWLTAALLQLAPDRRYIQGSSSGEISQPVKRTTGASEKKQQDDEHSVSDWETEEIWMEVLRRISIDAIREFLYQEARLVSVGSGPGNLLSSSSSSSPVSLN